MKNVVIMSKEEFDSIKLSIDIALGHIPEIEPSYHLERIRMNLEYVKNFLEKEED